MAFRTASLPSLIRAAALAAPLLLLPPLAPQAQTTTVPESREQLRLSFAPVVKRVAPAVVNIRTRSQQQGLYGDPFYRRFFGEEDARQERRSVGSGVIMRADGIVLTNHHVIKDATAIEVILADKRTFEAKVLVSDQRTDLAVLRIDPKGEKLPFLELRNSDEVEVGDFVLAIGNPFGVGQTVTSGIISAVARTTVELTDFRSFIQTDAAINPGNSGGALVTLDGKLVGINTAIVSRGGGNVGIGFAIPSNMVGAVMRAAIDGGGVIRRPSLGIGGQDVTAEIAKALGLAKIGGVIIKQIQPGGPADIGGLKVNDIILKIDGREIADVQDLRFRLATYTVGGTAKLLVMRDKREFEVDVPLRATAETTGSSTTVRGQSPFTGAQVAQLTQGLAEELNIRESNGVVITRIQPNTAAARWGFRAGDLILQINGADIRTLADLQQATAQAQTVWQIALKRQGRIIAATIR
jgi:serine protease Do